MSYTETKTTSWFSRLGNSFSGMLIGVLLVAGGSILLWWNEGNFVATQKALNEGQAVTKELGDITQVNPAMNGMLVHASGRAESKEVLTDPIFGIKTTALALYRNVEYYQWTEQSKTEKHEKLGGGEEVVTTYTYSKKWVSTPVDSSQFHDPSARQRNKNSLLMDVKKDTRYASDVNFGGYKLPDFFIHSISGRTPLQADLTYEVRSTLKKRISQRDPNNFLRKTSTNVHTEGNTIYLGTSPASPSPGDVRVTFFITPPSDISIIAKVKGNSFEQHYASNGKTVSRLAMGNVSLEHMFERAHSGNSSMTWILRVVGALLVIMGLKLIIAPLSVIASVIPLLGSIVRGGTGFVCFVLGLVWSFVIISIAWLRFRPLIGVIILAVAAALIALLYIKGRKAPAASDTSAV